MTETHAPFADAERLAPVPETRDAATADAWIRHHAATALAAWTVFDREIRFNVGHPTQGSHPEIGYLAALGVASTHAAVALNINTNTAQHLWDLTPEMGALNGEWEEWLTDTLDGLGINPADINPEYVASDFRSPSVGVEAVTTEYVCECDHQPDDHRGRAYACHLCPCPRFTPDIQRAVREAKGLARLERDLAELEARAPASIVQTARTGSAARRRGSPETLAMRTGQLKAARDQAEQAEAVLAERTAQLAEAQAMRDQAVKHAAARVQDTYAARAELASARTELDRLRADRRTWSEADA